jgi:hypothetical protein
MIVKHAIGTEDHFLTAPGKIGMVGILLTHRADFFKSEAPASIRGIWK